MSATPASSSYRPHLDGLRAIAVLAVVLYHAFPSALPGGFIGVDVFFVISGFLISGHLYQELAAPRASGLGVIGRFYARRIRRIFPALVVVLLAVLALGVWVMLPSELNLLATRVVASAGFYANLLFSRNLGYFQPDALSNPLLHLWSLGIEEQFYLIWPLALWLGWRSRLGFLPVAVFLGTCSYYWGAHLPPGSQAVAFFLPQIRFWELLLGSLAAFVGRTRHGGNFLSLAGLGLIAYGLVRIGPQTLFPGPVCLLPTVGAALILCADDSAWINRHVLGCRPMAGLGLISYPLYLWHWPLLSFSFLAIPNADRPAIRLGAVLLAVVAAAATYRWVETPLRRGGRVRGKIVGLAAAMAGVVALCGLVRVAGGLPWRFPEQIRAIDAYHFNPDVAWRRGTYFDGDFTGDPHEIRPGRPTLYLWGDSHAASLYPGFAAVYGARFNVAQRTTPGIPPVLSPQGKVSPGAAALNRQTLESMRTTHPRYVFLQANWITYDWRQVEETIRALQAMGVPHIVIIGPAPAWQGGLPRVLCNYYRTHRGEPLPKRLPEAWTSEAMAMDATMAGFAADLHVEYISLIHLLDGPGGILVRLGETPDLLLQYDYAHFTSSGGTYAVSLFPPLDSRP